MDLMFPSKLQETSSFSNLLYFFYSSINKENQYLDINAESFRALCFANSLPSIEMINLIVTNDEFFEVINDFLAFKLLLEIKEKVTKKTENGNLADLPALFKIGIEFYNKVRRVEEEFIVKVRSMTRLGIAKSTYFKDAPNVDGFLKLYIRKLFRLFETNGFTSKEMFVK